MADVFNPHTYQQEGINKIKTQKALALWWACGLGKSVTTLTAVQEMKDSGEVQHVLIIAPKRVAEATWQDEAARWEHLQRLRFSTVIGTAKQRIKAAEKDADIYVISRDSVKWLCDLYGKSWKWDMVVIDEASSFKSYSAQRFKALKGVRNKINRIVELTATPCPNGLEDMWSQLYLLDCGERLGKNITAFRNQYFIANNHGGYFTTHEPMKGAEDKVKEKIKDLCFSLSADDYLNLPDIIYNPIMVDLGKQQMKDYKAFAKHYVLEIAGGTDNITADNAAVLSGKLLQLAGGSVYVDGGDTYVTTHTAKLDALSELLDTLNGEPVLLFYNYRHEALRIALLLQAKKISFEYLDKESARDWNTGSVPVLLAHPASCCFGLNLQAGGHNIVWYSPSWNLEHWIQANARLHRQGQQNPVFVHMLTAKGTIDERVYKALQNKRKTEDDILDYLKENY